MRAKSPVIVRLILVAALALFLLSGCSPSGPAWVDSGTAYTTKSIAEIYPKVDITKLVGTSSTDTSKQRHDALTALRRRGAAASDAADLVTRTLPTDTHGVPEYVERATFNGVPALIVVEAIGPPKGQITTKRLWVLSNSGAVLFVGTR